MLDQFGRKIDYIRMSVTDRCNLRCRYCMPECGVEMVPHSDILTFDEIIRLTELFASLGISKVKITGGEPLVRKGISGLIRQIKEVPGIEQVTLTTNGVAIGQRPELAKELAEAGISGINISLDTLKEDRYEAITGSRSLEEVKRAIEACCSVPELTVKINAVTLADYNLDEIAELAALAKDRNLDVRFIEMMPVGLGRNFPGYTQEQVLERLREAYGTVVPCSGSGKESDVCSGNGPAVYYCADGFRGRIGFISAVSHMFCESCNRVRLTSEGFLKPCLQYADGADLRGPLRNGADEETLRGIIEGCIRRKAACHRFLSEEDCGKETAGMSFIGG